MLKNFIAQRNTLLFVAILLISLLSVFLFQGFFLLLINAIPSLLFKLIIPFIILFLGFLLGYNINRKKIKELLALKNSQVDMEKSLSHEAHKKLLKSEEELKRMNATKDKFFSIIAHDLKNPFNSLLGFTDLMKNDFDSLEEYELRKFIDLIYESSKQGFNLLENLLQWSRSQTSRIAFDPVETELKNLVNRTTELLAPNARKKHIDLIVDIPNNIKLKADEEMLSTVIRNLLSNAIKFTSAKGKVKITAKKFAHRIELMVIDTGIGIPAENIPKLFRIDVQVSSIGTENEKGTGLGLILCKEFVEKHGGKIKVTSEWKNGSEFKVILPLTKYK